MKLAHQIALHCLTMCFSADDYLQYLNGEVRGRAHRKEDEQVLTVKVEMAALQEGEGSEGQQVRLRLLDTPGTNEAGEERLRSTFCISQFQRSSKPIAAGRRVSQDRLRPGP